MDTPQEEMKFVGLLGIFTKSFKTILTWKKIFTQITLMILPLTIIFIAHMDISHKFFNDIEQEPFPLLANAYEYYRSDILQSSPTHLLHYLLFKTISITTVTALSLLSTAAVVYTIASVYTVGDVTYRKAMKVVPKVWKRLTVTFLCMFLTFFAYNLICSVVFFLWYVILAESVISIFVLFALVVPYISGFLYLSIVWQLASVVSVLENCYGLKAMIKGNDLMKGKRQPAFMLAFLVYGLLAGVTIMYMVFVIFDGGDLAPVWQMMIGIICCVLFVITFLLIMVSETVLYLVCKSHHREAIDKVSLSTYLGAYLSDSRPAFIVGEDIQLGRSQPVSQV